MLDFFFWVVMTCSSQISCVTNVSKDNKVFVITMCTKPGNPIGENEKEFYKKTWVEKDTGRRLVVNIDNCPQV